MKLFRRHHICAEISDVNVHFSLQSGLTSLSSSMPPSREEPFVGGGVSSYSVRGTSGAELIAMIQNAIVDPEHVVVFSALRLDDPLGNEIWDFQARVETIHLGRPVVAVDLVDQYGAWFQMDLDANAESIDFQVIS